METLGVNATSPQADPAYACGKQLLPRIGRGGQRHGRQLVHRAEPLPQQRLGSRQAIARGIGRHIGLIDRDTRNAQALAGQRGLVAHADRCREMNDIGAEVGEQALEPPLRRRRDAHLGIARQGQREDARHREAGVLLGETGILRGNHHCLVAFVPEVFEHPHDRMCHAVHLREERLRHYRNPHVTNVTRSSMSQGFAVPTPA